MKLFHVARRYQLTLQPQLILLQKTLLNIEGVGRQLDPELDIWVVARPVLERILRARYSPRHALKELNKRLPEIMTHAPDTPRLIHTWLVQQVESRKQNDVYLQQIRALAMTLQGLQRRVVNAIVGSGLLVAAAVLYGLHPDGLYLGTIPVWSLISGCVGALALFSAWWRS